METGSNSNILVERCKKGDLKAQHYLFEQYAKQMYNVAYRILVSEFEAEDAVQEAFITAFEKVRTFKGKSTFGAWLKRIVVNKCISYLRKRKVQFQSLDIIDEPFIQSEEEVKVDELIPIDMVMDAINSLPECARLVFTLKAIEEYKFREIAEILKISESNCKVQYHRSKKLLKERLSTVRKAFL